MKVELYDTTLRDGTQMEGISLSVKDKLKITQKLDELGVRYIEGGWPGSNPKDAEFFAAARSLRLKNAKIVAFGSTRRAGTAAEKDANLRALLQAGTPAVTIVGKANEIHVRDVLETTLEENLAMIRDSVAYLKSHGVAVFFDAEHFFDGFRDNPELRAGLPARRCGSRRRLPRPLRYERRHDHRQGRRSRRGGARAEGAVGHPRPQRRRPRRRQYARRRRSRRDTRSGHHQRLRRTLRKRQPGQRHRQPEAEDGHRLRQRRATGAPGGGLALRQRGREHDSRPAGALRRPQRLHPQGRDARRGSRQAPVELPARRPRERRQRETRPHLRAGRAAQRRYEAQGAGVRVFPEQRRGQSDCSTR